MKFVYCTKEEIKKSLLASHKILRMLRFFNKEIVQRRSVSVPALASRSSAAVDQKAAAAF